MKRSKNSSFVLTIAFLDILVVISSLLITWWVRSQFALFVYAPNRFLIIFPWVILMRISVNLFFGIYSARQITFNVNDFRNIIVYNSLVSFILLFFRLAVPVNSLKMPLSMIFIEFIVSNFLFILIRLIYNFYLLGNNRKIGFKYRPRIVLWGDWLDLNVITNLKEWEETTGVLVKGIINNNPISWSRIFNGKRIYGGLESLTLLVAEDDSVSVLLIISPELISSIDWEHTYKITESLNLKIAVLNRHNKMFEIADKEEINEIISINHSLLLNNF